MSFAKNDSSLDQLAGRTSRTTPKTTKQPLAYPWLTPWHGYIPSQTHAEPRNDEEAADAECRG